jgi:putative membrane protein
MKIILNWILSTLAIVIAAYLINAFWAGSIIIDSVWTALIAALVLGIVNALIKPVLVILTLPITLLTLGLFSLVVNALMVMLVSFIVPGFMVSGFLIALIFSVVLSVIGWALHKIA